MCPRLVNKLHTENTVPRGRREEREGGEIVISCYYALFGEREREEA